MKYTKYCVLTFLISLSHQGFASSALIAVDTTPLTFDTLIVPNYEIVNTMPKVEFQTIDRKETLILEIDAEKSFFFFKEGASRRWFWTVEQYSKITDSQTFSIRGKFFLDDSYFEDEYRVSAETKIKELEIFSELNNIELDQSFFLNESSVISQYSKSKVPNNFICSCSILGEGKIDYWKPTMSMSFDDAQLILGGSGVFSLNDEGQLVLDQTSDAEYTVSYYIEANVVSSVPIPAAFYLFGSAMLGLLFSSIRSKTNLNTLLLMLGDAI